MRLRQLLAFVLRFRQYVVLAALLLAAIGLMQVGTPERIPGIYALGASLIGALHELAGVVPNPFALHRENQLLSQLNTELLMEVTRLRRASTENEELRQLLELKRQAPYRPIFAEVVGTSVGQLRQYAVLDKGRADGVQPGMPVVTPAGLIGRIQVASAHFAIVELLENRGVRIAVRLEASGTEGMLAWEGAAGEFLLHYIPTSVPVQAGERVFTSASSDRFPPGLLVGVVREVQRDPASPFYRITVVPTVPYRSLRFAAVLAHLPNPERRALEERFAAPHGWR